MMGYPMARRLCEAGFAVHAWNRSRAKAERLQPFGAHVHDTPAQAVATTADVQAKPDAPVQTRCYSYGPYPDRAAAQEAKGKLGQLERSVLRELPVPATPGTSPHMARTCCWNWSVMQASSV